MASRDDLLNQPRSGARPLGGSPGASQGSPRQSPPRYSRPAPAGPAPSRPGTGKPSPKASTGSTGKPSPKGGAGPKAAPARKGKGRLATTRESAAFTGRGVKRVTQRRGGIGPKHTLTVELVIGLLIVLVRVVADYEPQGDGTVKGKVGHPQGQYGPLPVAAGLISVFFVLSFFVAKGGKLATAANAFGALMVLTLGLKTVEEFDKVAKTFPNWGAGKKPKGAWETSGLPAGSPVDGSGSGGLVPGWGGGQAPANPSGPIPKPKDGKCPAGYTESGGQCWPNVQANPEPM